MRIAIGGKGGVGKTTLAGTLVRLLGRRAGSALAVDGDSNPNLAVALGIPQETAMSVACVPKGIVERREVDGEDRLVVTETPQEIARLYGVPAPDGVTLLVIGRVGHAGSG